MHAVETILGHGFSNEKLLSAALTHPSLAGRAIDKHYQRLEFLGDRVLGLVVAEWLLELHPKEPEGVLNRRLVALVREESLAEIATELGIPAHIRCERSAAAAGVANAASVRADVVEALIGALYLDAGFDKAKAFVRQTLESRITGPAKVAKDPKSALQEWMQGKGAPLPDYELAGRSGPDHAPVFTIRVVAGGDSAEATAASKKEAEQRAAQALLEQLKGKA